MARRLGMHKLVSDLRAEWSHEIGMALKKTDMLMIRDRCQSIDLDGKIAPVFKEQFDRRHRQGSFEKFAYEGTLSNPLFPALNDFLVNLVDVSLSFACSQLHAKFGRHVGHRLFFDWFVANGSLPFDKGERKILPSDFPLTSSSSKHICFRFCTDCR